MVKQFSKNDIYQAALFLIWHRLKTFPFGFGLMQGSCKHSFYISEDTFDGYFLAS